MRCKASVSRLIRLAEQVLGLQCRWAAVPQEEWPTLQAQRDIITSDFDPDTPYGDRRQVRTALGR